MLTPAQALGYVRARYSIGDGSDLERIGRQQAFMSSLVSRVKSELLNPIAIYNFLDAATKSLTIDSQLGGITGLYDLGESLRGIPSSKIAFFTIPNFPRGEVVPGDTANVLWTQPEDDQIFASFRNDVPASSSLFPPDTSVTKTSIAADLSADGQHLESPSSSNSATSFTDPTPSTGPTSGTGPTPSASPASKPITIQARTGNQSICAG